MSPAQVTSSPTEPYDVLIVGGGVHSFSLVIRLLESTPATLYNDQEQQRYLKTARKQRKTKIAVVDNTGKSFNDKWNSNFSTFSISYLRSPVTVHPW